MIKIVTIKMAKLKFEFLFTGKNGCLQTEASIL